MPTFLSSVFFNETPPPEIYTLSLHDALPILSRRPAAHPGGRAATGQRARLFSRGRFLPVRDRHQGTKVCQRSLDRKSTRLNSSHMSISYAVFCLKKKKDQLDKHTQSANSSNT